MGGGQLVQAFLWLVYPLVVLFGLRIMEPRHVAVLLALSLILRRLQDANRLLRESSRVDQSVAAGLMILAGLTALINSELLLRLYPVAVSIGLLVVFAMSLSGSQTIVERFARIREPDLPPEGIAYTRRVTQIWCVFFVANGTVAAYTAFFASRETWSLYNGFIAYVLMGILFVGEYLWRRHVLARTAT